MVVANCLWKNSVLRRAAPALQSGEFLVSLKFPRVKAGLGAAYLRFIPRNEMDIAVVGVGAAVELDESRNNFVSARISLGAVAPTAALRCGSGGIVGGQAVNDANIAKLVKIAQAAAKPISDMRGTAEYRKHLRRYYRPVRTLQKAIERAEAS